ncbi:39S ribosomal protein L51, mitochondrial isoform X1 [Suricata suricatta]|uniref:39S ribosomal protein L51, mitochondrial isoform X1 n=1 Tax=Suricata suricatta TaxID=37032 RepID=UPI00115602DC|nr:39S ribosomal protein L51, mitochondrial isoform X1 [Suricata suricatta]
MWRPAGHFTLSLKISSPVEKGRETRAMAGSLTLGAGRILWGWVPVSCRSFSLGVPEMLHVRLTLPPPKVVDRWNEKRAMFGVYDNIGILGDFEMHPKELIRGPRWLRGWKGNELQRCIRKKKMVGNRMFLDDLHNLNKRISYLYKHFNRHGKYR